MKILNICRLLATIRRSIILAEIVSLQHVVSNPNLYRTGRPQGTIGTGDRERPRNWIDDMEDIEEAAVARIRERMTKLGLLSFSDGCE